MNALNQLTAPNQLNILQTLIALTNERDSGSVESSFAKAVCQQFNCESVHAYSAGKIKRGLFPHSKTENTNHGDFIAEDLLIALNDCLESNKVNISSIGNKTMLLFPQHSFKHRVIAVIAIEVAENFKDFESLTAFLTVYENFIALMHENQQDTLTGLLNRKTFDTQVNGIISGIMQNQYLPDQADDTGMYLAVFDIDHFKHVNDEFGHLMGDEVLLTFSQIMTRSFRENDLLFRFGGEEFIGIFQCPSDEAMNTVLNRFRNNIESHRFPMSEKVTVSIGFTMIHGEDLASKVIDRSDVALYYAKNNGRNQVCQHEQLVIAGEVSTQDNSGDIELF